MQFADDFVLIIKAQNLTDLLVFTNHYISKFNIELKKIYLDLNLSKTHSIIFNHRLNNFTNYNLTIENSIIKNVTHTKILSVIIDNKLNFNINTKTVKSTCNKYLNLLKIFSKSKGGAHPKTMLNLNRAIIDSRIVQ